MIFDTRSIAPQASSKVMYYYHNDHLGTPQMITDKNKTIVWQATQEPFGKTTITTNKITNNLRFLGQYYDQETNLNYNYYRDYDPTLGRYVESDPVGLRGGLNTYIYANANPLRFIDPLGLASLTTDMTGGTTTFDPRPENPTGSPITIPTRNDVDRRSSSYAHDPYSTPDVNWVPSGTRNIKYGPDGSYIDTGDIHGRDIHGGGSSLPDPFAPNQGWRPTFGCTRGQNADVRNLGQEIDDFKRKYHAPVPYTRY